MVSKDLAFGVTAIRRIMSELDKPAELEHAFALAILEQAKRNAASRPTPQAPMAARNLDVQAGSIGTIAGGDAAEVGIGSEFGSNQYLQFKAPSNQRGYWLWPATRSSEVATIEDDALEDLLVAAVNG